MKAIAVFPGQGAQAVGMGRALHDAAQASRAVFEEVDEALGERLSAVIFEGPEDALRRTANAQPALLAVSIAAVRAYEKEAGAVLTERAAYVAGHSLGEYSALVAAGALELAEAAKLLRLRGEAMQDAVPEGAGAMAAIMGLDAAGVEKLAADASTNGEICEFANDNSDAQMILSGHKAAVERAAAAAKPAGAKRAQMLAVSAPFHCSLMKPAADRLEAALAEARIHAPRAPVVTNVAAAPITDPEALRRGLVEQVTARVRWRETMNWARGEDISLLIEFGAGKILSGLAKRALGGATILALNGPDDVAAVASALAPA